MRPLIILLALLVVGCSFKTVITLPNGQEYTVLTQDDAFVHAKFANGVEIITDYRGNGGIMRDILTMWTMERIGKAEDTK